MHDIRLALRALRATPIVSAVAVLSLALGIGANTAIFSLVNSLMLRSMPVRNPEQLVLVANPAAPAIGAYVWSFPMFDEIRKRDLFDRTCAYFSTRLNLASGGETDFAVGLWASASYFDTLGVSPVLGRTFTDADDRPSSPPNAVISYGFWQRRFAGDTSVIGRSLTVERVPFTIIGVLPQAFSGAVVGRSADVVIPFGAEPLIHVGTESWLDDKDRGWVTIIGRLKPGQTSEQATAALRGVQPQIREATLPTNLPLSTSAEFLKAPLTMVPASGGNRFSPLRVRYEQALMTLFVVVGLVLLIACANNANLMLARAVARRHEMSLRSALGASRWRLARQLLVESIVLAGTGAVGGFLFAQWGSRVLVRLLSTVTEVYPVVLNLTPDVRVLGFTAGIAIAAALLFGVAPALVAARAAPIGALKEQGRSASGTRLRFANGLVVVQVALSLVLVVGAALFVRSFINLERVDLGFDANGILIVDINVMRVRPADRPATFDEVRRAVRRLPGIAGAGLAAITPTGGSQATMQVEVSGGTPVDSGAVSAEPSVAGLPLAPNMTAANNVDPGWLAVYKTPLVSGRDFSDVDRTGADVAIVNRAFAQKFLNGVDPVGHIVRSGSLGSDSNPVQREIVGMTADAVYNSLRGPAPPTLYLPFGKGGVGPPSPPFAYLSIRSAGPPPMSLGRSVASAIGAINPDIALTFRALPDLVSGSVNQERVLAILSGFFGALALLLAALGLYGVTSYSVNRRRGEIGIRMALGAAPEHVVWMVLHRVSLLVCLGIAIGALLSWWMASFVAATLLYGVQPRDWSATVSAALVLITVGALAGWLPARRASTIDRNRGRRKA